MILQIPVRAQDESRLTAVNVPLDIHCLAFVVNTMVQPYNHEAISSAIPGTLTDQASLSRSTEFAYDGFPSPRPIFFLLCTAFFYIFFCWNFRVYQDDMRCIA